MEVDVWTIRLDVDAFQIAGVDPLRLLDEAERCRAERFVFDADRRRFIHRRAALRMLLSTYCGASPCALEFLHGVNGKPFLSLSVGAGLDFNSSATHELAVVGVTRACLIGVDVEWIGREVDWTKIGQQVFASAELTRFQELAPEARRRAGFLCWTRKEAFVKGRGDGLSLPMNQFEVGVDPWEPARLRNLAPELSDDLVWELSDITVPSGYVGAIATTGLPAKIRLRNFWDEVARQPNAFT